MDEITQAQSFSSKYVESIGFQVKTSKFLEEYLDGGGNDRKGSVDYNISSFIVPLLMAILINLVFIGWFMVDGFSSSLVSRNTRQYFIVDRKGNRFSSNEFLTKVVVKDNYNNTYNFSPLEVILFA